MPSRKIPIGNRVPTGYFYSDKNGELVEHESPVERDFFLMLEFDDNVDKYKAQAVKVSKQINGKERPFFPDCLVTYKSKANMKPLLVEVKAAKDLQDPKKAGKLKIKISAVKEYAKKHGMNFKIVLDTDIRGRYLDNLKFLYRFTDPPSDLMTYKPKILKTLNTKGPLKVNDLLDAIAKDRAERALILPSIWHLLAEKTIKTDLDRPLTNGSVLERKR